MSFFPNFEDRPRDRNRVARIDGRHVHPLSAEDIRGTGRDAAEARGQSVPWTYGSCDRIDPSRMGLRCVWLVAGELMVVSGLRDRLHL